MAACAICQANKKTHKRELDGIVRCDACYKYLCRKGLDRQNISFSSKICTQCCKVLSHKYPLKDGLCKQCIYNNGRKPRRVCTQCGVMVSGQGTSPINRICHGMCYACNYGKDKGLIGRQRNQRRNKKGG